MSSAEIFIEAVNLAIGDLRDNQFEIQSETDLQALIFYHTLTLLKRSNLKLDIHLCVKRGSVHPDLVLGRDDVFAEFKLSKPGTGGYNKTKQEWEKDIDKLRYYQSHCANARCFFFAVDECGYHSRSTSANYFDPVQVGLNGTWSSITDSKRYIFGEPVSRKAATAV